MTNRWIILITGVLANLCVSSTYAFSVFAKPLMTTFKWTQSEVSLLFTIVLVMMPITMMIAGKVQDIKGPRMVFLIAGLAYGASWFLAGFADSLGYLYVVYGGMGGLGLGAVYSCTVVNTVKWFPDKRGLAAGLISAGLSAGPMFLAPLAVELIQNYGVLTTFKIYGAAFAIIICAAAMFSVSPPPGYKPAGWTPPPPTATSIVSSGDKTWKEMFSDHMFYIIWTMLVIAGISGLMIIGHAATIGQEVVKLSPAEAALAVSILAMANTLGRIFWGWVSDLIGRYMAMTAMFVLSAAAMLLLGNATTFMFFVVTIAAIASCYGGFFALFPPITGDMFGMKNLGINWGVVFTAFAPAAIIGPILAAKVKETNNGDYSQAFLFAAGLSIIGALFTLYSQKQMKKRHEALKN